MWLIAADTHGNVASFSAKGEELWMRHVRSLVAQGPTAGDINGDGEIEVCGDGGVEMCGVGGWVGMWLFEGCNLCSSLGPAVVDCWGVTAEVGQLGLGRVLLAC